MVKLQLLPDTFMIMMVLIIYDPNDDRCDVLAFGFYVAIPKEIVALKHPSSHTLDA